MILHTRMLSGRKPSRPCLVWLHGFLGSGNDWEHDPALFADWPQLWVDLPGHGASADCLCEGFAALNALLTATLAHAEVADYWMVGYSLGGRVAMYHACQHPVGLQGIIVEGGNPGLHTEHERQRRRLADEQWAVRFAAEPLRQVLADWYLQPVFAGLSTRARTELIDQRSRNNPVALAAMLRNLSLGVQPPLYQALAQLTVPFHYLSGERDTKFQAIARELGAPYHLIPDAGHNAHRDNPDAFAACITSVLRQYTEEKA